MARTLSPERLRKKEVAIFLAEEGNTYKRIGAALDIPFQTIGNWVKDAPIVRTSCFIMRKNGNISHNDSEVSYNPSDPHPPHPAPRLICAKAEELPLPDSHVDLIITSPPYNLGDDEWAMGGNISMSGKGRVAREKGIDYATHDDAMREESYQDWQLRAFKELYRVAKHGTSFFYNHKVRQTTGTIVHPLDWVRSRSGDSVRAMLTLPTDYLFVP